MRAEAQQDMTVGAQAAEYMPVLLPEAEQQASVSEEAALRPLSSSDAFPVLCPQSALHRTELPVRHMHRPEDPICNPLPAQLSLRADMMVQQLTEVVENKPALSPVASLYRRAAAHQVELEAQQRAQREKLVLRQRVPLEPHVQVLSHRPFAASVSSPVLYLRSAPYPVEFERALQHRPEGRTCYMSVPFEPLWAAADTVAPSPIRLRLQSVDQTASHRPASLKLKQQLPK